VAANEQYVGWQQLLFASLQLLCCQCYNKHRWKRYQCCQHTLMNACGAAVAAMCLQHGAPLRPTKPVSFAILLGFGEHCCRLLL
jgi:hypothetical protein